MSLLSTLALMITAAFRPKLESHRITELEEENIKLKEEIVDGRRTYEFWRNQADTWMMVAQERAFANSPANQQQLYAQQYLNPLNPQAQQALGLQNQNFTPAELNMFALHNQYNALACNCVPARHDMFLGIRQGP